MSRSNRPLAYPIPINWESFAAWPNYTGTVGRTASRTIATVLIPTLPRTLRPAALTLCLLSPERALIPVQSSLWRRRLPILDSLVLGSALLSSGDSISFQRLDIGEFPSHLVSPFSLPSRTLFPISDPFYYPAPAIFVPLGTPTSLNIDRFFLLFGFASLLFRCCCVLNDSEFYRFFFVFDLYRLKKGRPQC